MGFLESSKKKGIATVVGGLDKLMNTSLHAKESITVLPFFQGVLDRFSQIKPKVIFSVEAVRYNGKVHDHMTKLRQVVEGLPGLERVVLFPFCERPESIQTSTISNW